MQSTAGHSFLTVTREERESSLEVLFNGVEKRKKKKKCEHSHKMREFKIHSQSLGTTGNVGGKDDLQWPTRSIPVIQHLRGCARGC